MIKAFWDLLTQILIFFENQYLAKENTSCIPRIQGSASESESDSGSLGVGTDWELGETILAWNVN